ncbi:MAG: hypothetical protein H7269_03655, partial [Cellulomonas sp.]|nr:hypothetical protein [Cellulomonas sp.]
SAPQRRLVLAADVDGAAVSVAVHPEAAPSAVGVASGGPWGSIVCGHVDDPAAEPDVAAALTGDDAAVEHLDAHDLLWYDASELGAIPR